MGYGLHLFRPPPGTDLHEAGFHSFQHEGDGPATPESEARKRALADVLVAHDPRLVILPLDEGWTSEIPPPVELVPDDGSGIRIVLFDRTAAVELPYARSEGVWAQALGYIHVLEAAGGFRTFDPQTMDVLEPGVRSAAEDSAGYRRGNAVVRRVLDAADDLPPSHPHPPLM